MIEFIDSVPARYQSCYISRYEETTPPDADRTYVWATNFETDTFPQPFAPKPGVEWIAKSMDGATTYYTNNGNAGTLWGGAPVFEYTDPNPRLLQIISSVTYAHSTQNEEVYITLGDYSNIPDTSYGVIPPTALTTGTEQDYFQVVSTTAKNNTETSMTASGTKAFTRGGQISIYAACTVGTVTPGRLVLTAE